MTEFQIYCNHGVLGAEKRNVYTYSNQHAHAVCSDKISVRLPENDDFLYMKLPMANWQLKHHGTGSIQWTRFCREMQSLAFVQ